ncbi:redoxin domain-containing protein [bacterium]|nr:redoxin domain-containing protein [bacterium]
MLKKTINRNRLLGILFLLLFIPASVSYAVDAPEFWISNIDGKRFDSREYKGDIIISFFFVDCVPCKTEIPQLYKMVKDENLNIRLLFIDPIADDSKSSIAEFAGIRKVPTDFFYHDSIGILSQKFFQSNFKFPTIVGIRNGKIVFEVNDLEKESLSKIRKAFR